ncbi:MAG: hypothetical protein ACFFHV_10815 [Promethearchaeota archaeon]
MEYQKLNDKKYSVINTRTHWEFYLSLIIFWGIFFIILYYSMSLNNGNIIYSLDDCYIHMAIAKNFSQYGIWGINKDKFSSTSSSLLYTLLLSLIFFIIGPNELVPLILNLIFANFLIYQVYEIVKIKNQLPPYATFILLLSVIFFLPLHSLVFIGLEHTLQIIIDLYMIFIAVRILSDGHLQLNKYSLNRDKWTLLLIGPLVSMVRFEGMFIIVIICFLFLLRKDYKYSIMIGSISFLPIIIYGLISLSHGWFFFPNSVVVKSALLDFNSSSLDKKIKIFDPMGMFYYAPHLLIFFLGALLIFYIHCFNKKDIWNQKALIAIIFIATSICQIFFATVSLKGIYGSRYDAYLICIGIILIFISISKQLPQKLSFDILKNYFFKREDNLEYSFLRLLTIILIIIIFYTPLVHRGIETIEDIPQATNNIYDQQYQMGLFLKKYYNEKCIAANDIGAIDYLTDVKCVDLWGLGDIDTAKAIINDDLDNETIYDIAKKNNVIIAIIYESNYFGYEIPTEWIKAGQWTISDNRVCYSSKVSFYAVDTEKYDALINNLKDFSSFLPNTVKESGNYTESNT